MGTDFGVGSFTAGKKSILCENMLRISISVIGTGTFIVKGKLKNDWINLIGDNNITTQTVGIAPVLYDVEKYNEINIAVTGSGTIYYKSTSI